MKIGLYNSGQKPPSDEEPARDDLTIDELEQDKPARDEKKPEVDPHVKSLIQSVAFEIQKSFSQRNLRKVTSSYSNKWLK